MAAQIEPKRMSLENDYSMGSPFVYEENRKRHQLEQEGLPPDPMGGFNIDENLEAYENAALISTLDFSHLNVDDFGEVEYDDDGTPYGMVQGVPVAINTQPPAQTTPTAEAADPGYDKVGDDIKRGVLTGQRDAGRAFNETAATVVGAPVDLMNEGLQYLGLGSDYPIGGSDSIRDALASVVNFGSSLVPKEIEAQAENFAAQKPQSPLIQNIVNEITKFGINAVTPAVYLRAFTVATPFARGLAWGGIADFINAQPNDESAIAQITRELSGASPDERSAIENAVMTVLERNNTDPDFVNKARAALDGMVLGGAIEKGAEVLVSVVKSGVLQDAFENMVQEAKGGTLGMGVGPTGNRTRIGTTGQYIGAPPGVTSPQKLSALRARVSGLAREGATGRMWYEQSSKAILEAVGGDIDEADKLIQAIAVTSPGTPVKSNLDYALQAYAQWKSGNPIKTGRFPAAMSKKLNEIFSGEQWAGRKTDDFYNNLMIHIDPTRTGPVTGDIWMLRAFGFTKPNEMPSPRQYQFITEETQRIAKEFDWEPHQVQAAMWVTMKGRSENPAVKAATEASSERKGWIKFEKNSKGKKERVVLDPENHMKNWLKHALKHDLTDMDIDRAKFDYADAIADNRGQISWESIPSRSSGEMPEIFAAPYKQQAEYHVAVSKVFLDDAGEDVIAKRLGLLSPGDFEAPGFFDGKVSPGSQTIAIMPRQYKSVGTGSVEESSHELISAYAAVRGVLLKQDGVGWHRPFHKARRKDGNGILLSIGRPFSEAETKRLGDIMTELSGHGDYNPVSSEDGVRMLNFDFARKVSDGKGGFNPVVEDTWVDADKLLTNEEFENLVLKAIDMLELDNDVVINPGRFHAYTGYSGNNWSVNKNGENYFDSVTSEGSSNLQERVRDIIRELQPRVDEVNRDFSERYGWTINSDLNAIYRPESGVADQITQAEIPTKPAEASTQNPPTEAGFLMDK